jgi:hypothetical protein
LAIDIETSQQTQRQKCSEKRTASGGEITQFGILEKWQFVWDWLPVARKIQCRKHRAVNSSNQRGLKKLLVATSRSFVK